MVRQWGEGPEDMLMGGVNPYIRTSSIPLPKRPYRVTVAGSNQVIEVDPAQLPFGRDGRPGSLLDILLHHGAKVDHACGGVVSCSTCHVVIRQGYSSCNPPEEAEEDMLDTAPGLTTLSRLACQAVPDGSQDIVVEIPAWNRNQVKETD